MMRPRKLLCCLLMAAMASLSLPSRAARAAMADTEQMLDGTVAIEAGRTRLRALLQRARVQEELAVQGIDPAEALARIEALSDREVALLVGRLSEGPAGGVTTTEILLSDPRLVAYAVGAVIAIVVIVVVLIGSGLDAMFGPAEGEERARASSSGGDSGRGK